MKTNQKRFLRLLNGSPRSNTNRFCKIQWSHHTKEETTLEREEYLKDYPPFASQPESRDQDSHFAFFNLSHAYHLDHIKILAFHYGALSRTFSI